VGAPSLIPAERIGVSQPWFDAAVTGYLEHACDRLGCADDLTCEARYRRDLLHSQTALVVVFNSGLSMSAS
jgi:hypothetical protein